jgi:hypothetical protein
MRVTNRDTGEELTNFEIGLNRGDIERILPQLQRALEGMITLDDETGETIIGWTVNRVTSSAPSDPP